MAGISRRATIAGLALLAACDQPHRTAAEAHAIEATVQAWRDSGRSASRCQARDLSVLHAGDTEEFDGWCGSGAADVAASCLVPAWELIVLRPGQVLEPDGEPVAHETLHELILCMTSGLSTDAGHTLQWGWKARGPGTVQARAEAIYREP